MKKHERRFLIPDYSHPSYYFRLFHKGCPRGAEWAAEHTKTQRKGLEDWSDEKHTIDDLFRDTPAGEPASSVDPLADVW